MNKLIIIGDSFCHDKKSPESWVVQLMQDYDTFAYGLPATGWWTHLANFNKLKDHFDPEETTVIWVHSSNERLPNRLHAPITPSVTLYNLDNPNRFELDRFFNSRDNVTHKRVHNAARTFYLSELYDPSYFEYSELMWWSELSTRVLKDYKKVIFLSGIQNKKFNENIDRLLAPNSIVVKKELKRISAAENPNHVFRGVGDPRPNHFNAHNNAEMYQFLKDLIENKATNQAVDIDLSTWDITDSSKL
jgi:hypothetical protein